MKRSYMENPAAYTHAPRTMTEAFKDAEYASAIHVYKDANVGRLADLAMMIGVFMVAAFIAFSFLVLL